MTFEPDKIIRQGDFVLMLWRAAGKPAAETPASFADVMPEEYYAAAVAWAESAGIARGDGTGLFRPTDTLTREQAFTLLYRALDDLNIPYTDALPDVLGAFNDRDMLSDYAITPTATLVSMGVVSGAYGNLSPADAITRAGMAKILYEAMN